MEQGSLERVLLEECDHGAPKPDHEWACNQRGSIQPTGNWSADIATGVPSGVIRDPSSSSATRDTEMETETQSSLIGRKDWKKQYGTQATAESGSTGSSGSTGAEPSSTPWTEMTDSKTFQKKELNLQCR